ncbi:hypothetical protein ABZP36_004562 [Zizania latifolia]
MNFHCEFPCYYHKNSMRLLPRSVQSLLVNGKKPQQYPVHRSETRKEAVLPARSTLPCWSRNLRDATWKKLRLACNQDREEFPYLKTNLFQVNFILLISGFRQQKSRQSSTITVTPKSGMRIPS